MERTLLAWAGSRGQNNQLLMHWVVAAARTLADSQAHHFALFTLMKWTHAVHTAKAERVAERLGEATWRYGTGVAKSQLIPLTNVHNIDLSRGVPPQFHEALQPVPQDSPTPAS